MMIFFKKALTVFKVAIAAYKGRPVETLKLADTLVDTKEREKRVGTYPFCVHMEEEGKVGSSYYREQDVALKKVHGALAESRCAWMRKRN
jgi:hypothetical protein|tara:strand:- start:123 stop:392 length:270 start_codon:yes stop_codon:yes gene_type:complete